MISKPIRYTLFFLYACLAIILTCSYFPTSYHSKQRHATDKKLWCEFEWKNAEYEADINARASYTTSNEREERGLSFDEYTAQAKAWHDIREMARRGALGLLSEDEFTAKRQEVYKQFGLKIPDHHYEHAVYQILLKWANWPAGFPAMKSREEYNRLLQENPAHIQKLIDDLKLLAFPQIRKSHLPPQITTISNFKPKTDLDIVELLAHFKCDSEPAITNFKIWFGDEESGFACILKRNLQQLSKTQWNGCWNPKWKLVGSFAQHTEVAGSDLDVIIVLNPNSEDAVTLEWDESGEITAMWLKEQRLTNKRIIQLWDAFWKSCEHHVNQTHPKDAYLFIPEKINYNQSFVQIHNCEGSTDLLPALRTIDGTYLLFHLVDDSAKLMYNNSAEAARIIGPYMQWEYFSEVIRLLKILFREEWNNKFPKISSCIFEALAMEIAQEKGRLEWENAQLIELMHACMERLLWYFDTKTPIYPLNNHHDDLLGYHKSQEDKVESFREAIQKIGKHSTAEICDILQRAIDKKNKEVASQN